ncbi:MAG: hypothetical protein ABH842_00825 [Candidatus Micrarchaeota archaeon]
MRQLARDLRQQSNARVPTSGTGQDVKVLGASRIRELRAEFYTADERRQKSILRELVGIVDPKTRDRALSDLCRGVPYTQLEPQIAMIVDQMGNIVDKLESNALVGMVASRHTDRPTQETAMRILIARDCTSELGSVGFIARDVGIALWAVQELADRGKRWELSSIIGAHDTGRDRDVDQTVRNRARELLDQMKN